MKTVHQLLAELDRLEEIKTDVVNQVILQSTPRRLISEDVRNQTVLSLVDELREIQDKIDELKGMTF